VQHHNCTAFVPEKIFAPVSNANEDWAMPSVTVQTCPRSCDKADYRARTSKWSLKQRVIWPPDAASIFVSPDVVIGPPCPILSLEVVASLSNATSLEFSLPFDKPANPLCTCLIDHWEDLKTQTQSYLKL